MITASKQILMQCFYEHLTFVVKLTLKFLNLLVESVVGEHKGHPAIYSEK